MKTIKKLVLPCVALIIIVYACQKENFVEVSERIDPHEPTVIYEAGELSFKLGENEPVIKEGYAYKSENSISISSYLIECDDEGVTSFFTEDQNENELFLMLHLSPNRPNFQLSIGMLTIDQNGTLNTVKTGKVYFHRCDLTSDSIQIICTEDSIHGYIETDFYDSEVNTDCGSLEFSGRFSARFSLPLLDCPEYFIPNMFIFDQITKKTIYQGHTTGYQFPQGDGSNIYQIGNYFDSCAAYKNLLISEIDFTDIEVGDYNLDIFQTSDGSLELGDAFLAVQHNGKTVMASNRSANDCHKALDVQFDKINGDSIIGTATGHYYIEDPNGHDCNQYIDIGKFSTHFKLAVETCDPQHLGFSFRIREKAAFDGDGYFIDLREDNKSFFVTNFDLFLACFVGNNNTITHMWSPLFGIGIDTFGLMNVFGHQRADGAFVLQQSKLVAKVNGEIKEYIALFDADEYPVINISDFNDEFIQGSFEVEFDEFVDRKYYVPAGLISVKFRANKIECRNDPHLPLYYRFQGGSLGQTFENANLNYYTEQLSNNAYFISSSETNCTEDSAAIYSHINDLSIEDENGAIRLLVKKYKFNYRLEYARLVVVHNGEKKLVGINNTYGPILHRVNGQFNGDLNTEFYNVLPDGSLGECVGKLQILFNLFDQCQ